MLKEHHLPEYFDPTRLRAPLGGQKSVFPGYHQSKLIGAGYSEPDAAARLSSPHDYAGGAQFSLVLSWALEPPFLGDGQGESAQADGQMEEADIKIGRKIYTGPVHLQAGDPTCMPWAVMHSMIAVGRSPSPSFAAQLLNAAMPRPGPRGATEEGMYVYGARDFMNQHPESGVSFTPTDPVFESGPLFPKFFGRAVRRTIDDGSALVAIVNSRESANHAVAVVGYEVSESGLMGIQVIDSDQGEIVETPKGLGDRMVRSARNLSLAVVAPITGP
jgi:hypothetical protein